MDPDSYAHALGGSHLAGVRTGLFWLLLGAFVTVFMVTMLAPRMDGLVALPGHRIASPAATASPPRVRLTPAQRMVARRTAVKVALTQVGVRERGGSSNDGRRIRTYRRAVTGAGEQPWDAEPWCADFVSWAWARSGVPIGFGGRGSDYVPELVLWARMTGRWHWARAGYRPRSGDLIVYRSGGSLRGHVGMVVKVKGRRVHTVEGNLRNRVMRRSVTGWAPFVTGFVSPV